MAPNGSQCKPKDSQTDSEQEICSTIRYLDPDRDLKKGDLLLGIAWVLVLLLVFVFIYVLHD